jgi:hypothetical protein
MPNRRGSDQASIPSFQKRRDPLRPRGNGRAEQSDGDRMSRSSAMIAPVMIGATLALTSCTGDRAGDRSDVAGWRHRDGSAVSDLEFGQARAACSQTAMVQNPESAPFGTTMDPARGRAFLNAPPPPPSPSSTPNDAAQFVECLDSKDIVPPLEHYFRMVNALDSRAHALRSMREPRIPESLAWRARHPAGVAASLSGRAHGSTHDRTGDRQCQER